MLGEALLGGLGAALGLMVLAWIVSLIGRDTSVVDAFWGPAFVAGLTGAWWAAGQPASLLLIVIGAAVTLWAIRLAFHIAWRSRGRGEDPRYRAMRDKHPDSWPVRSLFTVFILQGAIVVIVGAPLWVVMASPTAVIGLVTWAGVALFVIGFLVESIADRQLQRFRDSGSDGVMDSGLWRYSRHPNYFGEALLWWGIGLMGVTAIHGWVALIGPLTITILLLRVSGVTLLEKHLHQKRPEYAAYVERTSAFVPWPPKKRGS